MLIKVIYTNDGLGLVEDSDLDLFIRNRKIMAFERSEGMVTVGRDPIRKHQEDFPGPDRRKEA